MSQFKKTLCLTLVFLMVTLSGCSDFLLSDTTTLSPTGESSEATTVVDSDATTTGLTVSTGETQTEPTTPQTKEETTTFVAAPDTTSAQPQATGTMKVHFINVGQGDAIFIELPGGKSMLIDAGDRNYGTSVSNYIQRRGYSSITYLVATHPHADHIGGLPQVINNFDIGSVYMPKVSHNTQTYENLLTAIQQKGLTIKTAKAGTSIESRPGLNINILAPARDNYSNLNDHSAVIKVVFGTTSFLFMGDAESSSESDISANVKADVLKVGHHGSRTSTSSSFLSKVSPKYAVIMCGAGNSYGHPHAETLTKLRSAGATIYRTDLNSTIVFTSNGKTISVSATETPAPTTNAPSTTRSQTNPSVSEFIGNRNTKVFHLPTCRSLPAPHNQVIFATRNQAIDAGYRACKNCNP